MFQVVFTGRLVEGADRGTVETELQRLFKANPRQVEWFLRGKPIVVKSCEDEALARRYFDALGKAGLECELRRDRAAAAAMSAPEDEPAPTAQKPVPPVARPPEPHTEEPPAKPRQEQPPEPPTEQESQSPVAPPGQQAAEQPAQAPPAESIPQQLSIPGVAPPPPKPAPATREARPRRPPKLGPVTQAITEQDQAPAFTTESPISAPAALLPTEEATTLRQLRRWPLGMLLLLVAAVLVGTLAYVAREAWVENRAAPGASSAPAPVATKPVVDAAVPATTQEDNEPQPQTPEALIVGRWQCVEASSGRVVENEFLADGSYRSLAHGLSAAFQQIDQMDVLVEGKYWLEGDRAVLHVQYIPSREAFGASPRADDYLYWQIESLTPDSLVWSDMQLNEVRESCLRSSALPG